MGLKFEIVGEGMTARQEVSLAESEPGALREYVEHGVASWNANFADGEDAFEGGTIFEEELCRGIVRIAGNGPFEKGSVPDLAREFLHLRGASMGNAAMRKAKDAAQRNAVARLQAFHAGAAFAKMVLKIDAEPDWQRGVKVLRGARAGHVEVHGTSDSTKARHRKLALDFEAETDKGTNATAAMHLVAERNNVSVRQVQRARREFE